MQKTRPCRPCPAPDPTDLDDAFYVPCLAHHLPRRTCTHGTGCPFTHTDEEAWRWNAVAIERNNVKIGCETTPWVLVKALMDDNAKCRQIIDEVEFS